MLILEYFLCVLSSFVLSKPNVQIEVLKNYIIKKCIQSNILYLRTEDTPLPPLYWNLSDDIHRMILFWRSDMNIIIKYFPDFITPLIINIFIFYLVYKSCRNKNIKINYIFITLICFILYIPLFILALDYCRWLSALTSWFLLLTMYIILKYKNQFDTKINNLNIIILTGIIFVQLYYNDAFGTIHPKMHIVSNLLYNIKLIFYSIYHFELLTN